jgi:acetolactate synthase-1/2/3 large subunit
MAQDHRQLSKGAAAVRDIKNLPDSGHLYAAHVIHDIWRITGGNAIVVTDVGQHQMWEAQYFHHEHPRSLVTSGGLGTMGFALPAAIGAKFACPDKEVWVVAGDGGFQMTAAELSTIVQEKIKINIAIINNGFLGMVRQWQEFFYDSNYEATPLISPDFVKLADAHGIPGLAVRTRAELAAAVEQRPHRAWHVSAQLPGRKGRVGLSDDSRRQRTPRNDPPPRQEPASRNAGR